MEIATIGFRSKTGRAIAIALSGTRSSPSFVARWEVYLYDPQLPPTGPHHQFMELPWAEAQSAIRPLESRIENIAIDALRKLLTDLESMGCRVDHIGVVGSPDRNLERIGNPHIRAHAAEGILFRRVLEVAAGQHHVSCRSFSDRSFEEMAGSELRRSEQEMKGVLSTIGRSAGKPWRTDERAAATAAWLMLSGS